MRRPRTPRASQRPSVRIGKRRRSWPKPNGPRAPRLLAPEALNALRTELLPRATVVTPNLDEVRLITGLDVTTEPDMLTAARTLTDLGPRWVLVKGGQI